MSKNDKMCDCNQGRMPCTCKPAEQHHGEPVALPARKDENSVSGVYGYSSGWNACLDEIAKLGPLYSRPVQVEPLEADGATFMGEPNFQHSIEWYREGISKHWKKICDQRLAIEAMQKQLAESQAMLRIYESFPGYLIDNCEGDTIYEESLQHWLADHIKALSASAEPSMPAEIDERAAFEAWYADWFNDLYKPAKPLTAESMKESRKGNNYGAGSLGKNGKWSGWQARAALTRKP